MSNHRVEKFISAAFKSNATPLHRNEALIMAAGAGDSQAVQRLIEDFAVRGARERAWVNPGGGYRDMTLFDRALLQDIHSV
jgi:hypothetical protein